MLPWSITGEAGSASKLRWPAKSGKERGGGGGCGGLKGRTVGWLVLNTATCSPPKKPGRFPWAYSVPLAE